MPDARRLRNFASFAGALVLIALAVGLFGNASGGLWLAVGALCASLAMLGVVWRLAAVAQEWLRELRSTRSELKRTLQRATRAQNLLRSLTDRLETPIFICDSQGAVRFSNAAARSMFDFDDPVGRSLLEVTLSYDLQQFLAEGGPGSPRTAEISLSHPEERVVRAATWSAEAEPETVFVALHDLTELRRLEIVRSDFVANVSHELRTPMAAIRAMTETILDDQTLADDTRGDYLNKIISEVDRLTLLSDDLLALSAAESKPAEKQEVDLVQIVRSVVQQTEPHIRDRSLSLNLELPEDMAIHGDGAQLIQVVMNLMSNAIRYTEEGSITVSLRQKDGEALLEVRDTGIGIPSEHLPRIFERFYRVDRARSRATGGTGLGLSIVRHIVEAHGGRVEVESELNVGSTFRVLLPIR